MPALVDLTGNKYHRLTVIGRAGKLPCGVILWDARCDCGNVTHATNSQLKSGNTKSCGCLHKEAAREQQKRMAAVVTKHGMSCTPEWVAWKNMRARCYDPKDKRYEDYHGRGISVCQEWLESFEAFFAHIGLKPSPRHTLDRKDNDGNYEPGNVRWATHIVQNNNKRTTPMVVFQGKLMSLSDAHRLSNSSLSYSGVKARLARGLSLEESL